MRVRCATESVYCTLVLVCPPMSAGALHGRRLLSKEAKGFSLFMPKQLANVQNFLRKSKAVRLWAGRLGNLPPRLAGLLTQEVQQFGVYFFRVRPGNAVWTVLHDQQARPFDELGGAQPCSRDGKDAVGITVNHQRGHIDTGQILAEVFVPGCDTRQAGGGRGASPDVPTGLHGLFAHTLP